MLRFFEGLVQQWVFDAVRELYEKDMGPKGNRTWNMNRGHLAPGKDNLAPDGNPHACHVASTTPESRQ